MMGRFKLRLPLVAVIAITMLLFMTSTFIGISTHEPPVEVTLDTFYHVNNKDEFFHHVDDMQRLRKSIAHELGQLERKRNDLRSTVESLNQKVKDTANQLKLAENCLAQVKSNTQAAKLSLDELNKDYAPIAPPVGIPMFINNSHFVPPKEACQLHSCFDYSRCSVVSGFPVYLYPLARDVTDRAILLWRDSISKSTYITNDPDTACIYIYLFTGNFKLGDLSHWKGDGRNHVIIDIIGNNLIAPKSRAMHARTQFHNYIPIRGFDIRLPYMNLHPVIETDLPLMLPVRRAALLSFHGAAPTLEASSGFVTALSKLHDPKLAVNIKTQCVTDTSCLTGWWCWCAKDELVNLKNSTFIVVPNDAYMPYSQFAKRLHLAIFNGAVPVVLGDHYPLPMNEQVPWSDAIIELPFQRVTELVYIVRNVLEPDIIALKKHGRFILENYLISVPKVADTLLDLIRTRIRIPPHAVPSPDSSLIYDEHNPMPMFETRIEPGELLGPVEDRYSSPSYQRNFTSWKGNAHRIPWSKSSHLYPYSPWDPILPTDAKYHGSPYGFRPINGGAGGTGKELSEALGGNYPREQFTIVILTYDRGELLQQQLAQFNGLPYLHKVVVVWNNPNYPFPAFQWPHIHVNIEVIKAAKNSLNNRFLPYKEIETEAVLSMDDDMYLRHDEIIFAFRVWRENRDRIVGLPGRYHAWNAKDQQWNYNSNHSCELSLVLTGAAFFHKYYMYRYSYIMPQAIRDKVDEFTNCEDIAMNFLVSHVTGKPPVKATSRWTFRCPTCAEASLWTDESHFNERHQCIQYFIQVYGYLPLLYTQLRTDSVLFKTRVPQDKTKCFSLV